MPLVLADNLAMKNHGGREEAEQRRFSRAALHKRLEVRVQLREESRFITPTRLAVPGFAAFESQRSSPSDERVGPPLPRSQPLL